MATVTKTIGTTSRDFSTITLWEADLDDDPTYDAGDDAVGECYDDSDFDEDIAFDGGGTIGLTSATITVASGERHDGTADTGVIINRTSGGLGTGIIRVAGVAGALVRQALWLDITSAAELDIERVIDFFDNSEHMSGHHLLIHDFSQLHSVGPLGYRVFSTSDAANGLFNSIIYALENTFTSHAEFAAVERAGGTAKFYNVTVHDISGDSANNVWGFKFADDAAVEVKNCISTDIANAGAGTGLSYEQAAPSNAIVDHNLASDTTASGTGSLDSKSAADQFVSTTVGSEDLHLKSGADAIDAGTDLGTTPSGVEIDIDERDRDAQGDIWDMGADEFVVEVVEALDVAEMLSLTPRWDNRMRFY